MRVSPWLALRLDTLALIGHHSVTMPRRPKQIRCSERAHDLAERLDPAANKGRAIEFALELAAIIEWRGPNREIGEGPETRHAGAVLSAFMREGEELWQGGARQALDELEVQTEKRAQVLAQEALPHHVEAAVKALFASWGMPVPPISVGSDGGLVIGVPPKGSGRIEA